MDDESFREALKGEPPVAGADARGVAPVSQVSGRAKAVRTSDRPEAAAKNPGARRPKHWLAAGLIRWARE